MKLDKSFQMATNILTNNTPKVSGSTVSFPDLRDQDHVLRAAHKTANALITPMAIYDIKFIGVMFRCYKRIYA